MQARWGTHGDHPIITLVPGSVRETFDLTVRAFNLSEKFRTPVVLLMDEIIGHVNEKLEMPDPDSFEIIERERPEIDPEKFLPYQHTASMVPPMASFGQGYRFHVTGLVHDETGFPTNNQAQIVKLLTRLNSKLAFHRDEIVYNETLKLEDAKIAIFAYGSASRSARRAVLLAREKGIPVGMLRPQVIWPFPRAEVLELAKQVSHILVPELNLGQIAETVEWASQFETEVVRVNRIDGEPINPYEILEKIVEIHRKL